MGFFKRSKNAPPTMDCPVCGNKATATWDEENGVFSKTSDFSCGCGWSESGCLSCRETRCRSWRGCQGSFLLVTVSAESYG